MSDVKVRPTYKPRPTAYRGVVMRSTLEATVGRRLDQFDLRWWYEPLRFMGQKVDWLPDFKVDGIVVHDRLLETDVGAYFDPRVQSVEVPDGVDLVSSAGLRETSVYVEVKPKWPQPAVVLSRMQAAWESVDIPLMLLVPGGLCLWAGRPERRLDSFHGSWLYACDTCRRVVVDVGAADERAIDEPPRRRPLNDPCQGCLMNKIREIA